MQIVLDKLFCREGGGAIFGFVQNLGIGNCTIDIVLMIFFVLFLVLQPPQFVMKR